MTTNRRTTFTCRICGQSRPAREMMPGDLIHGAVLDLVRARQPAWSPEDVICLDCLNRFRADYVAGALEAERGELSALDAEVLRSLREHETVAENLNVEFAQRLTAGERLADRLAGFGGSWRRLLEIQQIQTELMEELVHKPRRSGLR